MPSSVLNFYIIGTTNLLVQCAECLLSQGHTLRGIISPQAAIEAWASQHHLRHFFSLEAAKVDLLSNTFDYLLSIVNLWVLPKAIFAHPRFGAINYHDALLPRYRRVHATSWVILRGDSEHGISWHMVTEELDGGDLLEQGSVKVDPKDTALSLNLKCHEAAYSAFQRLSKRLVNNSELCPQPQAQQGSSYYGLYQKPPGNGWVNWACDGIEIDRLYRATQLGHEINNRFATLKFVHGGQAYLIEQLSLSPYNIYWWNKEGIALGCNNNTAEFLGLNSPDEFAGMTYAAVAKLAGWTAGQELSFQRDDIEVMTTGIAKLNIEEPPITNSKGEQFYYLTSRAPLYNENSEIIGIIGISTDITKLKRAEFELRTAKEQAEEASRAKIEFLCNIRHDFRTPLAGIIGVANLLKRDLPSLGKQPELINGLSESAEALLELLNQVLETARLLTDKAVPLRGKFDLKQRLQQIVALNCSRAMEKGLALELHYDDTLPDYFVAPCLYIQRIILELVNNALNFTQQGSVTIKVQKASQQENRYIIKFSVIDTGIGMLPNQQQLIYNQFAQLTPSYPQVCMNSGLGLLIVKGLVDQLRGELYIESQPNKGSSFHCILALNAALIDSPEYMELSSIP